MSLFELYFTLGLHHIADLKGYDHILFILIPGAETGLARPLFAFNVGIKAGQILVVVIIMLVSKGVVDLLRMPARDWHVLLSGAGLAISLVRMIERFPF
jgi:hypothetical protein